MVVFLAIYTTLFFYYRPSLLFSLTTTSGGDTGAHHYPADYLIHELLPNFRLTGWAPGWYAGMPMLTFYFPFPFLLIALLDFILPYQLAFKLVTAMGVFALPAAACAYGRLLRFRKPFPLLAAVLALGFVFMEGYTIYGGNILSNLAGEFGYSLSFALVFLFLGTLHRGMERGRFDLLFVLNGLILMALVLSHIVTTIALIFIVPGLLLINRRWRALGYMAAVFALGFCLTAFWGVPFVDKLEWTAHMAWDQLRGLNDLLPAQIRWVAGLGVVGMAYAAARKDSRVLPLLWTTVVMVVLFYVLPAGRLWNARLLPFFYLAIHLWAAYGLTWLVRPFMVMVRDLFRARASTARRIYPALIAVVVGLVVVGMSPTTQNWVQSRFKWDYSEYQGNAQGWIKWNYSGYERKDSWPLYKQINDFITSLPPGRVMFEHSQEINEFGTSRAFELLPYWTGHPTMEGTLMEASFTAPFVFINQSELSKEPSHAIIGVRYPPLDIPMGLTHLQLMNIPYLITVTPEVTEQVKADPRADLLGTFGGQNASQQEPASSVAEAAPRAVEYNVFRIAGTSGYVEVMANKPVRVTTDDWRTAAVDWYLDEASLTVPILWDRGEPELQQFDSVEPYDVTNLPVEPIQTEGHVTWESLSNESLEFETTAIGQPHWIKISYFPNWHVEGADGPFVVSPSFMMVIPRQSHVTLTYGRTLSNTVGQGLTGLGWLTLVGVAATCAIGARRRRGGAGGSVYEVAPGADRDGPVRSRGAAIDEERTPPGPDP